MPDDSVTTINELKQQVNKFVTAREWGKYHTAKNLTMSIAIEAAELMELYQWTDNEQDDVEEANIEKCDRLQEELADVVIYCLSLANTAGIDVSTAIMNKLAANDSKYPVDKVKGKYTKYTDL
ncbi:nucleotide pyrophosphohydrolase [Chloroflexota bacterium]